MLLEINCVGRLFLFRPILQRGTRDSTDESMFSIYRLLGVVWQRGDADFGCFAGGLFP